MRTCKQGQYISSVNNLFKERFVIEALTFSFLLDLFRRIMKK